MSPRALANAVQSTPSEIPWSVVGEGWSVALWAPHDSGNGPATLYLVDPAGGRYAISDIPTTEIAAVRLADWSGDRQRALITEINTDAKGNTSTTVIEIGLATGKVLHQFTVAGAASAEYTRPLGLALLVSEQHSLYRVYPTGEKQASYPTSLSSKGAKATYDGLPPLYSPDGTELVLGTNTGMALVYNNGQLARLLPSPTGFDCYPLSWWKNGEALAFCYTGKTSFELLGGQLWLVPISGSAPTALTARVAPQGSTVQTDAWHISSGTYVLDYELACGGAWWPAKLNANLTTSAVKVPSSEGNISVVGAYGDQLELLTALSCAQAGPGLSPPGESLLTENPVTGKEQVLLGPALKAHPAMGGTVTDAMLYQGTAISQSLLPLL
jgi:TolB protein